LRGLKKRDTVRKNIPINGPKSAYTQEYVWTATKIILSCTGLPGVNITKKLGEGLLF